MGGSSKYPPSDGAWRVKKNNVWKIDYPFFMPAQKDAMHTKIDETEVEDVLKMVELPLLRGSVQGQDSETCTYFAHFFVLLCLEHLTELRGFRGRWGFRRVDELVSFGLCFDGIQVDEILSTKEESNKVMLPGWKDEGTQTVAFAIPWGCTEEKLRFKKGESVILSRKDPLKHRICEGSVRNVDFIDRRLIVNMNGQLPRDDSYTNKYRIDVYANRTTYERQVIALLEFVSQKRTKICDMLVAAEVGQVDLAVLGGDGFNADKDKVGGNLKKEDEDEVVMKDTAEQTKAKLGLEHWDDDAWFTLQLKSDGIDGATLKKK